MKVLLDTHALIWWFDSSPRLGEAARHVLQSEDTAVFVSSVASWEIATKARVSRRSDGLPVLDLLAGAIAASRFKYLPVSWAHGERAGNLDGAHKDPFDRMLAAQSLIEGMPLVTADPAFRAFGVAVIW